MTPEEAARIIGVPAVQLRRWAWERVGPRNVGTRSKPRYEEEDLSEWCARKNGTAVHSLEPNREEPR